MAHIRLDDEEIELPVGELWIGADHDAGVRFGSSLSEGILAIITVDSRGTATVRRATSGDTVLVNGVALGAEPAPLLHGDRIEVAGRQLRFSDDRKAGSTVRMPAFDATASPAAAPQRGRAGVSGDRLVALVDGREYGFSANGVYVNSSRIGDAQPLRRGDIIRIGSEEFRFYADESYPPAPGRAPVTSSARGQAPSTDGDRAGSGARVTVGLRPPHPKRAPTVRPVGVPRVPKGTDPAPVSRRVPAAVWFAGAVLLGATVLLVLQDR